MANFGHKSNHMYKVILEVEGKTYGLSSINVNAYNRGSGYDPHPNDQTIQFQVKTVKMDQFLWDWVNSSDIKKKSGKIKMLDTDTGQPIQIISFEDGFSNSFNLSFYQSNEYSNETSITLSASKILITVNEQNAQPGGKKD